MSQEETTPAEVEPKVAAPVVDPDAPPEEPELSAAELSKLELPANFQQQVEAIIFTHDKPMSAGQIARSLDLLGAGSLVRRTVADLNRIYADSGRSFRVEEVAGEYRVLTLPEYAEVLGAIRRERSSTRLSVAALETLAVVAYKQPIIRADIDAIRGVACGETLKTLMEHHLVKQVGRAEAVGRPVLYGTTRRFLEVFGLGGLRDLPQQGEGAAPALAAGAAGADANLAKLEAVLAEPPAAPPAATEDTLPEDGANAATDGPGPGAADADAWETA